MPITPALRRPAWTRELRAGFARDFRGYLEDWKAFCRFPSISADPAHARDCAACAAWLARHLAGMGLKSRVLATAGKPAVFAERRGAPGHPTVLLYGHYDVQPPDPLDAWTTPPFEPSWRGGRLYARGAQDNKGQLLFALKAVEALIRRDALRCGVKVIVEGEEECGGPGFTRALAGWRDRLKADILMVQDTHGGPGGRPAITVSLRGIVHLTATLSGPRMDLHSGAHGGRAPNPATALARLVATLHDSGGRVAVRGFYAGVRPPARRDRRLVRQASFTPAAYRRETGVPPVGGERGIPAAERTAFRPCLDVNGLSAGYSGRGHKTIIPAVAMAKITARVTAGQDPARILRALAAHLRRRAPPGLTLDITECGVGGPGLKVDPASPAVARAAAVLREVCGRPPLYLWEGASIPIISKLSALSGASPLLVGFGRDGDRIHAPDESFSEAQFKAGYLYAAAFLEGL